MVHGRTQQHCHSDWLVRGQQRGLLWCWDLMVADCHCQLGESSAAGGACSEIIDLATQGKITGDLKRVPTQM